MIMEGEGKECRGGGRGEGGKGEEGGGTHQRRSAFGSAHYTCTVYTVKLTLDGHSNSLAH